MPQGALEDDTGNNSSSTAQTKLVSQPLATRLRLHSCQRGRDVDVYRSLIHCRGLFALRSFVKDEIIIEYLGEVIRSIVCEERERRYQEAHVDCFMFRIDADWVIDATMKGNAARFINHSCEPNCYSRVITMPDSTKHIVILANKEYVFSRIQFVIFVDFKYMDDVLVYVLGTGFMFLSV